MHLEYNTQEHIAILHMRNKNALMKYGNERASNYKIIFSFILIKISCIYRDCTIILI